MGKIVLAYDEVMILEDGDIAYSGSVEGVDYLEKISLTNKRIIAQWSKRIEKKKFEILLSDIKIYNNELQVDYFEDYEIGACLRVQTKNGIELFSLNAIEDESLLNSFKKMFASNSSKYRKINLWVDKIKEATSAKKASNTTTIKSEHVVSPVEFKKAVDSIKEVNTCSECGEKFAISARFCPSCGTSVEKTKVVTKPIIPLTPVEEVKKSREKTVHKCSICGEFLPSDTLKCPSCGNEIRGRETAISVREFFDKISNIDDENKKIEAIKLYPIPNNKEDITEFMFLASSSFDAEYYVTNKQGDNIANAWYTKIELCYKKTVMMFTEKADIQIVEKIYQEVQIKTNTIRRNRLIMKVTGIVLIIISVIMIGLSPRAEDGTAEVTLLSYISLAILTIGIISLVLGLKKKKTNKQIEEDKVAKMNKKRIR